MSAVTALSDLFAKDPLIDYGRRIRGARVAWLDESALLEDFPGLASVIGAPTVAAGQQHAPLESSSKSKLIEWLLCVGPLMSEAQLTSMAANDPIDTEPDPWPLARQRVYFGRTAMLDLSAVPDAASGVPGILDIKGCGVRKGQRPTKASHGTGLMTLHEALHDLVVQRIIERALNSVGVNVTGVPVYAILALGFDGYPGIPDAGIAPAAITLRRACSRAQSSGYGLLSQPVMSAEERRNLARLSLRIELLLRKFGITSTTQHKQWLPIPKLAALADVLACKPELNFNHLNIQSTSDISLHPFYAQLLDFDHYKFTDRFDGHLVSLTTDHLGESQASVLWEHDSAWFQPDPDLCVSEQVFSRKQYPDYLRTWGGFTAGSDANGARIFAAEFAHAFSEKGISVGDLEEAITAFIETALPKITLTARAYASS